MPEQDLQGKRALVTGGASGIGLACVREFAGRGATVIVADFNADAAQTVAAEVGGEAWVVDLADTAAQEDLALDVDILVNNAGIQTVAPIHEFDPERWRFMHRLMVESPFLLIRAALPAMYERGWGRIVNISSAHGLRGVTSNCINPAYVRTPLVEKQIADQAVVHGIAESEVVEKIMLTESVIKRLIEAEEVASLAGWLVSDRAGMVTGGSYTMDGGWTSR